MPDAFLSQLRRLVDGADATLGVRHSGTARTAFWLKDRVLGHLGCTGNTDGDAKIQGWVLRLDDVAQIDIDVKVVPGDWDDSPGVSGRVLKVKGNALVDASPRSALPEKLDEIEQFIDQILGVFAGVDTQ